MYKIHQVAIFRIHESCHISKHYNIDWFTCLKSHKNLTWSINQMSLVVIKILGRFFTLNVELQVGK
jgi:hypothetical protein